MRGIERVEDWRSRRLMSPMLKTASLILLILFEATLTALHAAEAPSGRLEHAGPEAGDVVAEAVEQRADVAPVAERPARVRLRAGVGGQPVAVPENAVGADVVVVVVLAVVAALDGEGEGFGAVRCAADQDAGGRKTLGPGDGGPEQRGERKDESVHGRHDRTRGRADARMRIEKRRGMP